MGFVGRLERDDYDMYLSCTQQISSAPGASDLRRSNAKLWHSAKSQDWLSLLRVIRNIIARPLSQVSQRVVAPYLKVLHVIKKRAQSGLKWFFCKKE